MTAEEPGPKAGVPWLNPMLQTRVPYRDNDIIISVPGKSGTTWSMNIVYQILNKGKADFEDIYLECRWLELRERPDQTDEELLERWARMPTDKPRVFKTHACPPIAQYFAPDENPKVKYLVVVRNPEEAIVSFRPFLANHSKSWFDKWGMPPIPLFPTVTEFWNAMGKNFAQWYGPFLEAWWPKRNNSNVLLLHFSELKAHREEYLRKIAEFLDVSLTDEEFARVSEYTSFPWMKEHADKFNFASLNVLNPNTMIRKGDVGSAAADGLTDEVSKELHNLVDTTVTDPVAREWFFKGGPTPQ